MSLWSEKYRPNDLQNLDYHKSQAVDLKNLTKHGDFPHLLFYGPLGAGKKTRIMCVLKELYGPGVEKLKVENFQFQTPSNQNMEIVTISSNYHIEFCPSDAGFHDRIVVMDVIKKIAQSQQVNLNVQRQFKVILLTDVDDLSNEAQHALRRTMEKYISHCRIILCATTISKILPAIRSRCLNIRVPAPTYEEIETILISTCSREGLTLPEGLAKRISRQSERNLRRALLMTETCKLEKYPFTDDQSITAPDWQEFIKNEVVHLMIDSQTPETILKIREKLTELICQRIPSEEIFKTIVNQLVANCDLTMITKIVEHAATFQHRMAQCGNNDKEIIHLEAFILNCMCLYRELIDDLMSVDF